MTTRGPRRSRAPAPSRGRPRAPGRRSRRAASGAAGSREGPTRSAALLPRLRTDRSQWEVCSPHGPRLAQERGDRAAPGARAHRHRQPAGERDGGRGALAGVPRAERRRVPALRAGSRAREPGGAASRPRPRCAAPSLPLPHRHRARRSGRVGRRSVVGRASRRPRVGPRGARHEGPGRGVGRRASRRSHARGSSRPATSSSSRRPTRRWAPASASPGS